MHEKLKFSWSHIIAYLALIGIAYVSYVGLFYNLDSGFVKPGIYTGFIIITLWFWFIGMQKIKGVSNVPLIKYFRFDKCIWVERIMIILSPVVLVLCLIPFNHTMNIIDNAQKIKDSHKNTISFSMQLFEDYENYCNQRILKYTEFLNEVSANKGKQNIDIYNLLGFDGKNDSVKINLEKETLERQLLGTNYNKLKTEVLGDGKSSCGWIGKANNTTSVLNVFMIGNISVIEKAIRSWSFDLEKFSELLLTTENPMEKKTFDSNENIMKNVNNGFSTMRGIYSQDKDYKGLNHRTVLYSILIYFLLLFPYLVEYRHPLNHYNLLKRK